MKAKLLGYTKTSTHKDADTEEYQDHDTGDTTYIFFVELDKRIYKFEAIYSYGSCYSGYCGASWGDIKENLLETELPISFYKTKKEVFVEIVNNAVVKSIIDSEDSWDATTTTINSTEGEKIVLGTGDGGCGYYSSGVISLNEELFNQ